MSKKNEPLKAVYSGIFIDDAEVLGVLGDSEHYSTIPKNMHVTLEWYDDKLSPEELEQDLVNHLGDEVTLKIVGYQKNESSEGFKVEILDDNINDLFKESTPHITVSYEPPATAKDTANLDFNDDSYNGIELKGQVAILTNKYKIETNPEILGLEKQEQDFGMDL